MGARLLETNKSDETDEADTYVEVGDKPEKQHEFLQFQLYQASDVIVQRLRRELYNNNSGPRLHENLVERQDIKFQGFDWVLRFSWTNESNSEGKYTRTVTEGQTLRSGQETERNFGVSAAFKGIGISVGGSRKQFSEQETSQTVSVAKEIIVEPQNTTFFYQKRYNFVVEVWFWQRVPAWENHNHFGVGETGAAWRTVKRTAEIYIESQEYATLLRRLTGTTHVSAFTVPPLWDDPPVNRQFQNITQRAKDTLARFGIRG